MKYKIEYEYDTERINEEASMKGWRSDVIASIDGNKFMLNIIDPIRLSQDFESEMLKYGFYNMEPNTIIVKEVFKSEIEKTIKKLVNLCYFDKLGPAKYSINNGNKIYHLPFDQQYYRTQIKLPGECYVTTVKEAVDKGFRRARRHVFEK